MNETNNSKPVIKIGLLGAGTIGGSVIKFLNSNQKYSRPSS